MRTSRVVQRAKVQCPLRYDAFVRSTPPLLQRPLPFATPKRWDWRSELAPMPEASDYEAPGLAFHGVLNHHRIAQGLPWLLWDAAYLYRYAIAFDDHPDTTEDYPRLVGIEALALALEAGGVGSPVNVGGHVGSDGTEIAFTEHYHLSSIVEIERAIRVYGPIVIAFDWYNEWADPHYGPLPNLIHTPWLGTLRNEKEDEEEEEEEEEEKPEPARTCMVAYGYDHQRNRLHCRTSFGESYGRRGDVDLSYHEINRQLHGDRFEALVLTTNTLRA